MQQPQWYKSRTPWYEPPASFAEQAGRTAKTAIVIGAGLSGAAVAHSLAGLGLAVTVLERNVMPAQGASGNLSGALHPLVTADWNLRSQWYWQGLQASLRFLKPQLSAQTIQGELKGLMHLAVDEKNHQRMQQALKRVAHLHDFAYWCDALQASEKLGGATAFPGLFFPQAGWFNPPSIVAQCLSHDNIQLECNAEIVELNQDKIHQAWWVKTTKQDWQADILVLATGALSALNEPLNLPIRPVKGQVSELPPDNQAWRLKTAVAHQGYSAPAPHGYAVTGATFEAPDLSPIPSNEADEQNQQMVASCLPSWLTSDSPAETGRVSFRPTTPDHLPIIGAMPDSDWMAQHYFNQSPSHTPYRFPPQKYQSGLYVSNGHGARGLMSVFLAAEMIAAQIVGKALPIESRLYAASHPARFAIRQWQRLQQPTGQTQEMLG